MMHYSVCRDESKRVPWQGKPTTKLQIRSVDSINKYPLPGVCLWQMSSSVLKIVLGLVQVISKQPEVLKEDFPGIMWDSDWLKVFSFDFSWVVRCEQT